MPYLSLGTGFALPGSSERPVGVPPAGRAPAGVSFSIQWTRSNGPFSMQGTLARVGRRCTHGAFGRLSLADRGFDSRGGLPGGVWARASDGATGARPAARSGEASDR